MYDQHIIYPGSLRKTDSGWSIGARLPYYRGQPLSVVEDVILTIDGAAVPRDQVRFSVRGKTWTLDQLDEATSERWEFGEVATVTALTGDGLAPGEHQVGVAVQLRISYLPWSPTTSCSRTEMLAA